jgi:hypothetical protein
VIKFVNVVLSITPLLLMLFACQQIEGETELSSVHLPDPVVVDKSNVRRRHVSTRPHNRKIIYYPAGGYWFVFYGHGDKDPDGKHRISWRSSNDGIRWSKRHTAFEGNSHSSSVDVLLSGDRVIMLVFRPHYYREKAAIPEFRNGKQWYDRPEEDFFLPYEICQLRIKGGDLIPGPIYTVMNGTAFKGRPHYGSLVQDSEGYFWVGARAFTDGVKSPYQVWVARSQRKNDISKWQSHDVIFTTTRSGTVVVQLVALDMGRVFAVIFSSGERKIYGTLYDPSKGQWDHPYVVAEGNGESKRPVALFDPGSERMHLVTIDNSGALRHKILKAPFGIHDWTPAAGMEIPGIMIVRDIRTSPSMDNNISLAIDTSRIPAPMIAAYHKETPHYYLRRYNGQRWEETEYPVGIRDEHRYADEISLIKDYSVKLGMIYYVMPSEGERGELHFVEIPGSAFARK